MVAKDVLDGLTLLWRIWSIQGFMILSLTMQLVLNLVAPLRKKTSNSAVNWIIWLAYLLADWTAIFTFGLISNAGCKNSPSDLDGTKDLLGLWASFLLIHLGGPDTITAFALEDNSLWFRHLIGLIVQVITFLLIFVKTLPNKTLVAPTLLVFATGVIKYGERTRAMYLASLENFKDTINLPNKVNEVYLAEFRSKWMDFHKINLKRQSPVLPIFMGLIVDIMPNRTQRLFSREIFLNMKAELAFKFIEIELNLLYEVLYTKIIGAHSSWGVITRDFAYYMSIAALILFCSNNKEGLKPVDVSITYAALAGVIALDATSEVMLTTFYWRLKKWENLTKQIVSRCIIPSLMTSLIYAIMIRLLYVCGCESFVERLWSGKMGSFNLLTYSFKEGRRKGSPRSHPIFGWLYDLTLVELRKIKEVIDKMSYTKKNRMDDGIWEHIFTILKGRASDPVEVDRVEMKYEARGELALQETSENWKRYVTGFEYNHSVLLWHVATEICYNTDTNLNKDNENVKFSKILSDYMMYLMVNQPDMMSAVADIFHHRFHDTSRELKRFKAKNLNEFWSAISANVPDHQDVKVDKSVLIDSCSLVKILGETPGKWEIIRKVWVELLLYAAGHCRADSHAKVVSKGGEFVTFVWMLMAHFGIGPHFPKH